MEKTSIRRKLQKRCRKEKKSYKNDNNGDLYWAETAINTMHFMSYMYQLFTKANDETKTSRKMYKSIIIAMQN